MSDMTCDVADCVATITFTRQLLPLFASDDFGESVKSFMEKRPAMFTGR